MPPKKPFRRDNNKKKNGKKIVADKSAVGADGEKGGSSFESLTDIDSDWLEPERKSSSNSCSKSSPKGNKTTGKGLYGVYKRATQRFKESLMALVPANIFARDGVQTIMDAVDYIVDQQQSVDPSLVEDCRISLHFRKRYSKQFQDGGDEGHDYFILVLGYCFESLKPLVPQSKLKPANESEKRFSFTDLDIDSDDGEEEDDDGGDNDDSPAPPVRPQEPENDFTIEDLVESTDRCQACLFLFNVEKCMKVVAKKFAGLKKKACYLRDNGIEDPSYLIGPLMTCAAATNFSIRQVQLMEEELEVNLPHLSTFPRVIACVFLKSGIDEFELLAREHGKTVPRCEATAFVGDIMEQVFRLPDDLLTNCCERLVRAFCRKWSLPFDEINELGKAVVAHAIVETNPRALQAITETFPDMPSPHQWLRKIKYTGGDRSIINTHAHVQQTAKDLSQPRLDTDPPKVYVAQGALGSLWDERQCPAQKIQGDMDQLLREEILPELLLNCLYGPLGKYIPKLDECLPLIKLLKDFVGNPAKPIPLSLTFGIHAILTSIYELQGDDDVATIAKAAENANNIYFKQIDELLDQPDFATHGVWPKDVTMLLYYKILTASVETDEQVLARTYWNPCCAGMFLTYICFKVNVGVGSRCMNCLEQLRMILHLSNAFQQRGLAVESIPLLTSLDKYFEGTQYVWWGEKPTRENILKRFLISYGVKADAVRKMHQDCRGFVIDKKPSSFESLHKTRDDRGETRSMRKVAGDCRPSDISNAYRKICLGDFDGMSPSEEWSAHEMDEDDWEWNMQYTRFLDDTMTAMVHEEELTSWNLTTLGCCLSGFLHFLSDRLGWQTTLEDLTAQVVHLESESRRGKRGQTKPDSSAYKGMAHAHAHSVFFRKWFLNHLLGPLEFLDSVEDDPEIVAARDCLVEYFTALDPAKYKIFHVLSDDLSDGIGWGQEEEAETGSETDDLDSAQEQENDSDDEDEEEVNDSDDEDEEDENDSDYEDEEGLEQLNVDPEQVQDES